MKKLFIPILLITFIISACAPVTVRPNVNKNELAEEIKYEKELVYKAITEGEDRLFRITYPILENNAQFCKKQVTPDFGFTVWSVFNVEDNYKETAKSLYKLHSGLTIKNVGTRSPASRAGLKSGDLILSLNGKKIKKGPEAKKELYKKLISVGEKPIKLILERNKKIIKTTVHPSLICNYPVIFDHKTEEANAWTDGEKIVVTAGISRLANSNELALIISHELAHATMGHISKKRTNAFIGGLGGLAIDALLASTGVSTGNEFGKWGSKLGGTAHSIEFEHEADYVGMYYLERAGYSSKNTAAFWRKMAINKMGSVTIKNSHPTSPERFLSIRKTYEEIKDKKERKIDLLPNLKKLKKTSTKH